MRDNLNCFSLAKREAFLAPSGTLDGTLFPQKSIDLSRAVGSSDVTLSATISFYCRNVHNIEVNALFFLIRNVSKKI